MCICWRVTEINYKIHGATIKIIISILFLSAFRHLRYFMQPAQYSFSNVSANFHIKSFIIHIFILLLTVITIGLLSSMSHACVYCINVSLQKFIQRIIQTLDLVFVAAAVCCLNSIQATLLCHLFCIIFFSRYSIFSYSEDSRCFWASCVISCSEVNAM